MARIIEADGSAVGIDGARNNALGALSASIFVLIESHAESFQDDKGHSYFNSIAKTSSHLPIIGAEFDCVVVHENVHESAHEIVHKEKTKKHFCHIRLDTEKSSPLYIWQIEKRRNEINSAYLSLNDLPSASKNKHRRYEYLQSLLSIYEELDKLVSVLSYLSPAAVDNLNPVVARADVMQAMHELEQSIDSMDLAVQVLTQDITQKKIYIAPAALENSHEVTPFASVLLAKMRSQLDSVSNVTRANYVFKGRYDLLDEGMVLRYVLSDMFGKTLTTVVVELSPSAYSTYRVQPLLLDFDRLLHQGYVIADDFRVQINTNKGSHQLLFLEGEIIEVLVKTNRPAYFYMVAYIKDERQELSYLLPLNEAHNLRRFVRYVNADDANKWLSLGAYEVQAPFGIESLRLIASETDLVANLPYVELSAEGYYLISKNMKEALLQSRGLQRIRRQSGELSQEDVLMFTTLPVELGE